MPWTIQHRDSQYCVVKEGETEPVPGGCHATRGQAIKHQRALYAAEARVASAYEELDAKTEEYASILTAQEPPRSADASWLGEKAHELQVAIAGENAMVAAAMSLLERTEYVAKRLAEDEQERRALIGALQMLAEKPPPTVTVEAPQITVEAPEMPAIRIPKPEIIVQAAAAPAAPEVNFSPEIVMPAEKKKAREVTFTRDRQGRLTGATVEED